MDKKRDEAARYHQWALTLEKQRDAANERIRVLEASNKVLYAAEERRIREGNQETILRVQAGTAMAKLDAAQKRIRVLERIVALMRDPCAASDDANEAWDDARKALREYDALGKDDE